MRSRQAYDDLAAAGFNNLTMLTGGIQACKKAGVNVIVVRRTIPIIRQVMITAGSLLLIGLYLGRAGVGSAYGAAGSLVVVIVWVYYASMILLFGAALTCVRSRSAGLARSG